VTPCVLSARFGPPGCARFSSFLTESFEPGHSLLSRRPVKMTERAKAPSPFRSHPDRPIAQMLGNLAQSHTAPPPSSPHITHNILTHEPHNLIPRHHFRICAPNSESAQGASAQPQSATAFFLRATADKNERTRFREPALPTPFSLPTERLLGVLPSTLESTSKRRGFPGSRVLRAAVRGPHHAHPCPPEIPTQRDTSISNIDNRRHSRTNARHEVGRSPTF
jgi:hypothetical protein